MSSSKVSKYESKMTREHSRKHKEYMVYNCSKYNNQYCDISTSISSEEELLVSFEQKYRKNIFYNVRG